MDREFIQFLSSFSSFHSSSKGHRASVNPITPTFSLFTMDNIAAKPLPRHECARTPQSHSYVGVGRPAFIFGFARSPATISIDARRHSHFHYSQQRSRSVVLTRSAFKRMDTMAVKALPYGRKCSTETVVMELVNLHLHSHKCL